MIEAERIATPEEVRRRNPLWTTLVIGGGALVLLSLVRVVTGADDLTSHQTFSATVRLGVPILLAGLGGLWAERAGVVNIGLEGMMILGTWFGAWAGVEFGPWMGVLLGVAGGAVGGLLHAVATVTFGIDHIVSGVAINILAAGVARFLSVVAYEGSTTGGGPTQSPQVEGDVGSFSVPVLADGPDVLADVSGERWFLISDVAALLRGLTGDLSWLTVITFVLVGLSWYLLWRTAFGLRLRSVGEHPVAAESLGVPVYTMKYIGVVVSGALAGLAGAFLVLEAASIYREGQTAGRGFIGLAAVIFGNWRPGGVAAASGLFGYADGLRLRSGGEGVHDLLLFVSIVFVLAGAWYILRKRQPGLGATLLVLSGLSLWWFLVADTVPSEFISFTPHLVTLMVLALAAQRLRPPMADGLQYRRGQLH